MTDLQANAQAALERARDHLLERQNEAGWWKAELETNVTMDAEDLLMREFLGIRTREETALAANWIRSQQREDGSWATFFGGPPDLSTTIEAYAALRLAEDPPEAEHMKRAREVVLGLGGIEHSRVFTRIWLALFGEWRWDDLPALPPEVMLLPSWFPLNIYDFACWARQTIVPLTIVGAHRPVRPLPFSLSELRAGARVEERHPFSTWKGRLQRLDRALHLYEKRPLRKVREHAMRLGAEWIIARQEADGSWGGIQPPWVYSILALHLLGYPMDHPVIRKGLAGLDGFLIEEGDERRLEACQSPVWDTALAMVALRDAGVAPDHPAMQLGADWLLQEEIRIPGDWSVRRPNLPPGGWAFEFDNDRYPDTDDTAEVILALRAVQTGDPDALEAAIARGVRWTFGMQSADEGWGAFDVDNTRAICRELPFCDFGEVIDPPSADVTAHVVEMLAEEGKGDDPRVQGGVRWLLANQEDDGSWFGRWGANHLYGTGAVVPALVAAGLPTDHEAIRRSVRWLYRVQNEDGGWGEDLRSYTDEGEPGLGDSTASQTAWALLALLAAGERGAAIDRGIAWLVDTQRGDGDWNEPQFTGTGFPGDFYIRYHLYRLSFPMMALGRYLGLRPEGHSAWSAHPPNGIVWAPLRLEAWALRLGAPGLPVVRCGMGPGRAEAAARSRASELGAWLVLGLCGATDPRLRVGDVFVPDAVRLPEGGERRLAAASLRATLADAGFAVADGLLASADHVVRGSERAAFHASGVRAVDMESAWLAKHAGDRDLAVVRVVVDAPAQELREAGFPLRAWRGLSALRRLAPLISNWMGSHALPVTPLPAVR